MNPRHKTLATVYFLTYCKNPRPAKGTSFIVLLNATQVKQCHSRKTQRNIYTCRKTHHRLVRMFDLNRT